MLREVIFDYKIGVFFFYFVYVLIKKISCIYFVIKSDELFYRIVYYACEVFRGEKKEYEQKYNLV